MTVYGTELGELARVQNVITSVAIYSPPVNIDDPRVASIEPLPYGPQTPNIWIAH